MRKIVLLATVMLSTAFIALVSEEGKFKYSDFQTPAYCGTACHNDIYRQWQNSMMAKAFTHEWDEIEYFDLAVPHSEIDEKVAEVKAGCNGCHSPLAYLTGDIPPSRPSENTRANEAVSCDVCHSITGFSGEIPYNFNYVIQPGHTKFSSRISDLQSPNHKIEINPIMKTGDFCGICHNEKSPYNVWVKSTHLEWKEGPYFKEGVQCQDCHMPKAESRISSLGKVFPDARQHLFNGAHDKGKLRGTIEVSVFSDLKEAEPGETVKISVTLFNQKTGHKFPTGSVEDRLVWLSVEAIDSKGNSRLLPVDKKGFAGEEYTISADALAYQDLGIPLKLKNFEGLQRDGIPFGCRIFRMPYFDPQGKMTIQQWNTASLGVDYRFAPRETKIETFTFKIPENAPNGNMKIRAIVYYQLLVKPVGEFLKVPVEEYQPSAINENITEITILD